MSLFKNDTIVALATAPLAAGVAVIRLSGPQAKAALSALYAPFFEVKPRQMIFGTLVNDSGETLDKALLVYFQAPHSFTGEDVVEVHCHGGRAVVQAVLDALLACEGVRHAETGEFSKRAFLNQKMDLTEAEGLADLIEAETEEQRKQALRQMDGALGHMFEGWRADVMHLVAHTEAALDFPDEELDVLAEAGLEDKVVQLIGKLKTALASDAGQRVREGFQVAILGRPNAGKSTLTNLLSGKDTAIVSPIAGTTRDVVEAHLNIQGYPVVLADTAGMRETDDAIEAQGVARAHRRREQADVVIVVVDAATWKGAQDVDMCSLLKPERTLIVVSKVDTAPDSHVPNELVYEDVTYPILGLNLVDNGALPDVMGALSTLIEQHYGQTQGAAALTRERHKAALADALSHLERAHGLFHTPTEMSLADLLAQDLRDAAAAIGRVTGRTGSEDVLDLVFSTFCIGK